MYLLVVAISLVFSFTPHSEGASTSRQNVPLTIGAVLGISEAKPPFKGGPSGKVSNHTELQVKQHSTNHVKVDSMYIDSAELNKSPAGPHIDDKTRSPVNALNRTNKSTDSNVESNNFAGGTELAHSSSLPNVEVNIFGGELVDTRGEFGEQVVPGVEKLSLNQIIPYVQSFPSNSALNPFQRGTPFFFRPTHSIPIPDWGMLEDAKPTGRTSYLEEDFEIWTNSSRAPDYATHYTPPVNWKNWLIGDRRDHLEKPLLEEVQFEHRCKDDKFDCDVCLIDMETVFERWMLCSRAVQMDLKEPEKTESLTTQRKNESQQGTNMNNDSVRGTLLSKFTLGIDRHCILLMYKKRLLKELHSLDTDNPKLNQKMFKDSMLKGERLYYSRFKLEVDISEMAAEYSWKEGRMGQTPRALYIEGVLRHCAEKADIEEFTDRQRLTYYMQACGGGSMPVAPTELINFLYTENPFNDRTPNFANIIRSLHNLNTTLSCCPNVYGCGEMMGIVAKYNNYFLQAQNKEVEFHIILDLLDNLSDFCEQNARASPKERFLQIAEYSEVEEVDIIKPFVESLFPFTQLIDDLAQMIPIAVSRPNAVWQTKGPSQYHQFIGYYTDRKSLTYYYNYYGYLLRPEPSPAVRTDLEYDALKCSQIMITKSYKIQRRALLCSCVFKTPANEKFDSPIAQSVFPRNPFQDEVDMAQMKSSRPNHGGYFTIESYLNKWETALQTVVTYAQKVFTHFRPQGNNARASRTNKPDRFPEDINIDRLLQFSLKDDANFTSQAELGFLLTAKYLYEVNTYFETEKNVIKALCTDADDVLTFLNQLEGRPINGSYIDKIIHAINFIHIMHYKTVDNLKKVQPDWQESTVASSFSGNMSTQQQYSPEIPMHAGLEYLKDALEFMRNLPN